MILLDSHCLTVVTDTGTILPLDIRKFVREIWNIIDRDQEALLPEIEKSLIDSILSFLSEHYSNHPISLEALCKLMSGLLLDFSRERRSPREVIEIDLDHLATEFGEAFELGFFLKIQQIFRPLTFSNSLSSPDPTNRKSAIRFHIVGLKQCAKHLSNRRRWCQTSSRLRDEIVQYIREQVTIQNIQDLSISVS
jgi:hypothetical protein